MTGTSQDQHWVGIRQIKNKQTPGEGSVYVMKLKEFGQILEAVIRNLVRWRNVVADTVQGEPRG